MSFVCLSIPRWPTGAGLGGAPNAALRFSDGADLVAALLAITPHAVAGARGIVWLDAHGLDATDVATRARAIAKRAGAGAHRADDEPRAGVACSAIAAEVAAIHGHAPLVTVPPGSDAAFLAPFPLAVLGPMLSIATACADLGLVRCGDLARLPREAVEVRLGTDGLALWRLARAEDPRRIFPPLQRSLPSASLAWEKYILRNTEELVFIANRLVTTICTELRSWGEAARTLTLGLTLADRAEIEHQLRLSRPTASRAAWMRLVRLELDRLRLPSGVVGLSLRVDAAGAEESRQGDIFDRGFPTAGAVHDALDRLGDDDGIATLVEPAPSAHPLPEHRSAWRVREPGDIARAGHAAPAAETWPGAPQLLLQLLPELRRVAVKTTRRRGHDHVPARLRTPEGQDLELLTVIGPDLVSAGTETGTPYGREYFTCLADNGLLVLLFRDATTKGWYLHGWWD